MHACMYVYMYVHICMYACMYVCMYVCMYARVVWPIPVIVYILENDLIECVA